MQQSVSPSEALAAADGDLVSRRVWDLPTRLGHWLLAALTLLCWWSGQTHRMETHRLSGYGVFWLVTFRLYWGFQGGATARFAQFLRGPRDVLRYARALFGGYAKGAFGHNPMGGWSVVALLAALAAMTVTGFFAVDVDGIESGPLSYLVSFDQGRLAASIHHLCFNALLVLLALHLTAIAVYGFWRRNDLVGPMITGRKLAPRADADVRASLWRAAAGAVIASAVTLAVIRGLRW